MMIEFFLDSIMINLTFQRSKLFFESNEVSRSRLTERTKFAETFVEERIRGPTAESCMC